MKKTARIKTNNQELFIRKQKKSDATSRRIENVKSCDRSLSDERFILKGMPVR